MHGDGICRSLHPGILPETAYAQALPDDLREARTGIPAIDLAVRTLYVEGYLHNHARMWLASYVVHLRKVSWRAGADWMVAHLLDGDLASNHLGWQWVAATAGTKPYLFNADNVARFAPAAWHSPGTAIDASYEALDAIARRPFPAPPHTPPGPTARSSPTSPSSPASAATSAAPPASPAAPPLLTAPSVLTAPPATLTFSPPRVETVADRDVWLIHPWALRAPPPDLPAGIILVGVFIAEFHRRWPWSSARWRFVGQRLQALTPHCWYADEAEIAATLRAARSVTTVADPHFSLGGLETLHTRPAPQLFAGIDRPCNSFSQWWSHVTAALNVSPRVPR
jgi:deoxyribodipyrimidine photo-lyase